MSRLVACAARAVIAMTVLSSCGSAESASTAPLESRSVPQQAASTEATGENNTSHNEDGVLDSKEVARSFRYSLYTHCGIRFASFNGRTWATPSLSDGSGNPPPGWDNPSQSGRMYVLTTGVAMFASLGHRLLRFHPTGAVPPLCD